MINRLDNDSLLGIEWFGNNSMKLNQDICHLTFSGHKYENVLASVGQPIIWDTENQKLLGIIIDRKLNFNDYVTSTCKKADKKLSVLARLSYYISTKKEGFFSKHL